MRPLNLSGSQRQHYDQLGVLAIDACGHEVLLGLTAQESAFVVECSNKAPGALTEPQRLQLARLLTRHEQARLRGLPLSDAPGKDESSLG